MRPEEIRKLLGGYAAGNLTAEEQQALFAAALEDQELFDALGREQALRDLLRDPAARGELLAALERPPSGFAAFWQWLRQPMVAGVVTTCFLAVAGVAVWRGIYPGPDRIIVADLRQEEMRSPAPQAVLPGPGAPRDLPLAAPRMAPRARESADAKTEVMQAPAAPAAPLAQAAGGGGGARRFEAAEMKDNASAPMEKKEMDAIAGAAPSGPAPAPPPPPAAAVAVSATAESVEVRAKSLQSPDARTFFYMAPPMGAVSGFVQSTELARQGSAAGTRAASGSAGAPATTGALGASTITGAAAAPRLGVRVSILRGGQEVDTTTALNAGESVRLKIIPNAEGFLSVTEGTRVIASGAAHRMQAFETPPMAYTAAGARRLTITFSRTPVSGGFATADAAANLVEPSADEGRATYVVSNEALNGSQVVVPVTLNYR